MADAGVVICTLSWVMLLLVGAAVEARYVGGADGLKMVFGAGNTEGDGDALVGVESTVGNREGTSVGAGTGKGVGKRVSKAAGAAVGTTVGKCTGLRVSVAVGARIGAFVGEGVGT
jgi:hypothetical protein